VARLAAALLVALLPALIVAPHDGRADAPVADFHLSASDGRRVSLWSGSQSFAAQVVGVCSAVDPQRKASLARLVAIARERAGRVRVLVLCPDPSGPDGEAAAAIGRELPAESFALLEDPFAIATRRMGFMRADDVLVVDRDLKLFWRGSSRGGDETAASERSPFLAGVVDALLGGGPPPAPPPDVASAPVTGAALTLATPKRKVTWYRDLLPVVRAQCGVCHQKNGIGPMDLLDADEARGDAPMMAEVTEKGIMPPWSADPRFAPCKNERRLTDTEKQLFCLFAEQGAKLGDKPKDAPSAATPPPAATSDGIAWTIGTPDVVWQIPKPESIPAEGVLEYRSALLKPDLPGVDGDAWIEAFECRPTAPQVTHHLVAILVPDGVPDEKAAELSTTFPDAVMGGYVPGAPAIWFPPGCARRLKKGQRIVLSIHYTTNGKAAVDQTRIGVRFARGPVLHEVHGALLATTQIDIPPGASGVECVAVQKVEKPIRILSVQVHMHARGSAFRYELLHKEGEKSERRLLFSIPRFDWNWQHYYELADPIDVEAGDVLGAIATYDNSSANPRNPDPTARVVNGPQSWNEMMNGYYQYIDRPAADGTTPRAPEPGAGRH
jgi:mono/diheme cytochrome c family protein